MVVDSLLRDAAIRGDEETFRRLVHNGEDANTVISALLLGAASLDELDASRAHVSTSGRLAILSFLLETHSLSLCTLNASHSTLKGLTPLGMAAYLNRLDFVTVLLEEGDGLVLVDGVDSQRATPIMYAARDGHTDIVQYMACQGARIDSVDCYHRSVLFYAISSPQCLWACESYLRLERAQSLLSHSKKRNLKLTLQLDVSEYNSLACLYRRHTTYPISTSDLQCCVNRLVSSVASSDLSTVHSLLFPLRDSRESSSPVPALVNFPDENGWSPIHYCVTSPRPNTAVLDALYLAGADLTLYTTDNTMAPLHALARFGGATSSVSFRLYAFIVHLVRDLGAPLNAVDLNGETCIHVAARHGHCADVLMAFLECDADGEAVKMKNNCGQTAYEVAKPEFRSAFEHDDATIRPDSASSLRTIKPSYSSLSLMTSRSSNSSNSSDSEADEPLPQEQFSRPIAREKEKLRAELMNPAEAQQILDDLEYVSEQLQNAQVHGGTIAYGMSKGKAKEPVDLDDLENLVRYTCQNGSELLERFRQLIDAEFDDFHAAQDVHIVLQQLIVRLEQRVSGNEEGGLRETPLLSCDRRSSVTPSLTTSGSSSAVSLTSLADHAALVTPTGSPRTSAQIFNTPKAVDMQGKSVSEELEIDFACTLSAGSTPRYKRLSTIFTGTETSTTYSEPYSPFEAGVNLVSIPPVRTSEMRDPSDQLQSLGSLGHESWLNPYVRRANSDILKAHLSNLLEIEQMLFGKEDREREDVPSPGSVADEDDHVSWRECIEDVEALEEEDGNFLEMFDGDDDDDDDEPAAEEVVRSDDDQFLDLFASPESGANVVYAPTLGTTRGPNGHLDARGSFSVVHILESARRELSAVEECMITACRSIETAQRYISQAERLTSDIFRKMEQAVQATRLSLALNDVCTSDITAQRSRERSGTLESMVYVPTPTSSPVTQRRMAFSNTNTSTCADSRAFSLHPPPSRDLQEGDRKPSGRSLMSATSVVQTRDVSNDEMRALHRVLVRKIPIWLDATAYDVDKAGTWVGIVQAVVHNAQRIRL